MLISASQADQIAALLNERNELTVPYARSRILADSEDYICHFDDMGNVIAFMEVKKTQWYQAEFRHLTVALEVERRGHARSLLQEAENLARTRNARIAQCTIREGNIASQRLFESVGFKRTGIFFNSRSGSNVGVFIKILSIPS